MPKLAFSVIPTTLWAACNGHGGYSVGTTPVRTGLGNGYFQSKLRGFESANEAMHVSSVYRHDAGSGGILTVSAGGVSENPCELEATTRPYPRQTWRHTPG